MAKKKKHAVWRFLKRLFLGMFVAQLLYIVLCKWINPPITFTQLSSWIQGNGLQKDNVSSSGLGPEIKLAVIASEDQLFPYHDGFDVKAIKKARAHNKLHPHKIRGASTISQQTAKNVFLWQGRGYVRKGLEVYFTFMIEALWSKERILQTYLNVAETGNGIFGAQAAAQKYFKKDASKLTVREAALIAAILPSPKKYKVKPPGKYVSRRANQIVQQMNIIRSDSTVNALIK